MGRLNIVWVIVAPRSTHAFRFFVFPYDLRRVGEFFVADRAAIVLFGDFLLYQFVHSGVIAAFSISAKMV